MKDFALRRVAAWQWRILIFAVLMTSAAVGLACLVAQVTFPLFVPTPGDGVLSAVAVTALLVALPVVLALVWLTQRSEEQKRDLAAREELFTTALRIGKLGYWHYDLATDQVILSDNVHDLLGDPDRTLRMRLKDLLQRTHPEDRDQLHKSLARIAEDGASEQNEYRFTGLDEVEKTFWIDGQRMLGTNGKPIRVYGACQDVTERRQIEAALRESEDHYRHAVELNPQIPWIADSKGNILEIGPLWFAYVGMEHEEALGRGWLSALHPDDLAPIVQLWSEARESGAPIDAEYRVRQANGDYRWFRTRGAARRTDAGEIIRWYGTLEDVDDRKKADAALRESEAFAHGILASTPDAIRVLDLDGRVQFMNEPGLKALGINDLNEVKDVYWPGLWPDAAQADMIKAIDAARNGRPSRFFGFCPTSSGAPRWWNVTTSPIFGLDGAPDRLLVISRDMSSEKQAQDETQQARMKAEQAARRLENVLSSTSDCVITLDPCLRYTFLNRQSQEIIAHGRDLVGLTHAEAFPEAGLNPFQSYCEKALSQQVPVHFEGNLAPHDVWLDGRIYPTPDGLSVFLKDVTEQNRTQEQLLYLAHHDPLTGLVNRSILQEQLERALVAPSPTKQAALLFLDLDEFKAINDTLGHTVGDRVLIKVAERLRASVRSSDTVARFGGDEFAVVALVKDQQEALAFADRIIETFKRPLTLDGHAIILGTSIGIVMVSAPGARADDVLRDADIALYQAKAEGRGVYQIFSSEMGESVKERQGLKHDLKDAVQRGELFLEYQPLVDLVTSRITGFEGLVRWNHPSRGLVPPATFIPVAEESGCILEIGEWVLDQACGEAASWPGELLVAVNLSPVQFRCGNLAKTVARSLFDAGLPARKLQLEITESVLLAENDANLAALHALRQLGVSISMDDFGTGYSSLSYLRSFPFDKIKIDQAFVSDLSRDDGKIGEPRAIVRAIVELARGFGIRTTAEGVETEYQVCALRNMGCNEGQGYLFSKPVTADEIPALIARLGGSRETPTDFLRAVP